MATLADPIVLTVETAPRYLGQAIGARLGTRVLMATANEVRRPTARGFKHAELDGHDVLVVADVVNSGDSIRPLVKAATHGASTSVHLVAFATLHHEESAAVFGELGVSGTCLVSARWDAYEHDVCPACDAGRELMPAFEFN